MKTAVDTNVLIDVLTNSAFADASKAALRQAISEGSLVIGEIVFAELAAAFQGDAKALRRFIADLQITRIPGPDEAWILAGATWRRYRSAGGSRKRILPDFLIGAHALKVSERLLTRDRGFFRQWFEGLTVWEP